MLAPMKSSTTIWVLVAGLAVGFLIGREMPRGGKGGDDTPDKTSSAAGTKSGNGPTQIPSDWITEDQFAAKEQFAGLTPAQRYTALKVLNETPCDCGCPHGSIAKCKKDDPACPRGPQWVQQTVAMVKDGKDAAAIVAAVKKPAPTPQAPEPSVPQKVELAAWNPIEGPKHAKVTIVEFSDFQ